MSEENIKKLKELKEKLIIRNNTEKEINDFIKAFFNYFYSDYQLLFTNLDTFHNIFALMLDEIEEFILAYKKILNNGDNEKDINIDFNKIEKLSINSKILLLKDFYQKLNIDIDLDKLINEGILNIEFLDLSDAIEKNLIFNGYCGLDDNEERIEIKIYDTGLITDLFTWVHEIAHYFNMNNPKTEVNMLLTESISYTYELLLLDYLSNLGYTYEASSYQFEFLRNLHACLYHAYYINKLYTVYHKLGEINIENYKTIFGYDDDYDIALEDFYNEVDKNLMAIFRLTYYSLALVLSPYMYYEWQKDPNFIENIKRFNESITYKPLIPALNDINITGFDNESIKKIKTSLVNYKNEILYGNDYILVKCARINDYFKEITDLFYEDKPMIFNKIDDIVVLNKYLKDILVDFFKESFPNLDINKITKCSKEEKLKIIEDYYKYMNYEIDMADLINNSFIEDIPLDELNRVIEEDPNDLIHYSLVGYNTDDNGYNEIDINNTPYLLDTAGWIHEFRHHLNYPGKPRNQESSVLTEASAFLEELLFADYLDKIGYTYESTFIKCETYNTFYILLLDGYPINKLLKVYTTGEVSKPNYKKVFNDDEFEDLLDEAIPLLSDDSTNFLDGIRYTLACALSTYMYEKYKENPNYIETIKEFETHINDGDLYKALNIIGLTGLDTPSLTKINNALINFQNELNKYLDNNIINLFDINKQKVIKRNLPTM